MSGTQTTEPGAGAPAVPARPVDENGFEQRSHREILLVMSGLMVAMLLAMLDNMIVAPALPTIVGDLGGLEHLAWVTTAYILGTAVGTPIWGKLGDLFNRKTVFMGSIVLFIAGSALCGAAQDMNQLIAFRALQGVGAGGLIVGVMAVLGVLIPPRDRGKYMGYFMAIMPVSMIAGPLIGGAITDHASWRWAFYVNVPLAGVALFVIAATMKLPTPAKKKVTIDWLGAGLMTTWITALVLVTSWGGTEYGWGSPTILGLIALTLVAFVAFLIVQAKVAEPIMPLGVFKNLNFSLAAGLSFVVGFAMFGGMTFLPQFQQYVQGASATNSGLLLLPLMMGVIISSTGAGQLVTRTGHYKSWPIVGTILMTTGLALLTTLDVDTSRTRSGLFMFVLGLGMGLLFQTTMLIAQNSVELKDIGAATAASTFIRSIGGSIGVSMLGALYAHHLTDTLSDRLGGDNPLGDGGAQLSPAVVRTMPANVIDGLQHAITDGIVGVFTVSTPIAAVGILIAVFIKQVPLRGSGPKAPAATAAAVNGPTSGAPTAVESVPAAGPGLRICAQDGTPVGRATITILDSAGRQLEVGHADEQGGYLPSQAGAQAYAVVAGAPGFAPQAGLLSAPNGAAQRVVLTRLLPVAQPAPAQLTSSH